ncbi:MAG: protein-glutamate O-methyltransferase CheR [Spirochaetales bacterium]|jgi:chemotaxis protein methyltransferase CheR|nr:protein-glutamate O-methyltransferase CheR [Spirochaetales bacterium]
MSDFLGDVDFEKFRSLIYKESGITFSDTNRTILESRLRERVKLASVATVGDYYNRILKDGEELKVLLDAVTTNLTRFFRNTAHFDTFIKYVIPDLLKCKAAKGDREIRIWSAGCSTGEEPYTLAMILKDILPAGINCKLVASDISLKCLITGKEGFYPETRVEGISPQYLTRFFEKKGGGYQVKDEIKNLIRFDYHNLKNDSGLRNLDVVFCRNVLIYFDEAAQKAAVERFWDAMSGHSFLFIGHSESLFGMDTKFEFLKTEWACIYKKFV